MINLEYKRFVTGMSELFCNYDGKERVIVGESPYNDGGNLNSVPGYPYREVAFLRSTAAVWPTKITVKRIWGLLFNDKVDEVRYLLNQVNDPGATSTKEEYLAKYLAEEQKFYLINAFENHDCKIITGDLKNLNADVECREILIVGKKALCGIKYLSKNEIKFIMHPSARGLNKETVAKQWDSFSHKGTGIYNSSDEIINVFQIK